MYISRMPLNTARYAAKQLIASPYRLHAAVEKSFPPSAVRSDDGGRILWRLDFSRDGDSTWLYVVSPERPDFTHIVEQAGWPTHAEWEVKDYEPLITHIAKGQEWAFRLRANPARQRVMGRPVSFPNAARSSSLTGAARSPWSQPNSMDSFV